MNQRLTRGFFLTTLALNVLLVSLMLLDHSYAESRFFTAILISFGVLVIVTAAVMFLFVWEEKASQNDEGELVTTVTDDSGRVKRLRKPISEPTVVPTSVHRADDARASEEETSETAIPSRR